MFTVAIDFDGVLNNLPEVWCKYLNDMYYTNQKSEQVDVPRNYNMSLNFNKLSHESINWPLHRDDFWEKQGTKIQVRKNQLMFSDLNSRLSMS